MKPAPKPSATLAIGEISADLLRVLAVAPTKRNAKQKAVVREHFVATSKTLAPLKRDVAALQKKRDRTAEGTARPTTISRITSRDGKREKRLDASEAAAS